MSLPSGLDAQRVRALFEHETAFYRERHPRSLELAAQAAPHYLFGLPMHWMRDWSTPVPLHVERANGVELVCVDGHRYVDLCLGDTGAMFGHSPQPVAAAVARQVSQGMTAMLPSHLSGEVGRLLSRTFGLPNWQVTLSATDANRFVLRWARAITGRPKVLVFDGCYHGTVDDTLVDMHGPGRARSRASLLGQVHDLALTTVVVPFNDTAAVEQALAGDDVCCVLTEPALTNCGLVPALPGFLEQLQDNCRQRGVLFVLDETHTLSTGYGGYARVHGLEPDFVVIGKAIAGGFPAAVYGFSAAVRERMEAAKRAAPDGHSGIGTTLSGSLLAMAALHASLAEVVTREQHDKMNATAALLENLLTQVIQRRQLGWSVTRLGARMEIQFRPTAPRDASESRAVTDEMTERALHLYLANRGWLATPFHNMLLVAPQLNEEQGAALAKAVDAFLAHLT